VPTLSNFPAAVLEGIYTTSMIMFISSKGGEEKKKLKENLKEKKEKLDY